MFDKRLLCTGGAIAATVILSLFLSGLPREDSDIGGEAAGAYVSQEIPREDEPEYAYLIKEYNGKIAVFAAGKNEPEILFETLVKYLPDYDREQMKKGVQVKDFEELSRIIEDYIS